MKVAPRVQKLHAYLAAAEIAEGAIFRRVRRVRSDPTAACSPLVYRVYEPLSYAGLKFILRSRFAAAELSAHLSPHSLRHSFITLAIRGGATLAQVQAAARHADGTTGSELFAYRLPQVISKKVGSIWAGLILSRCRQMGK